MKERNQKQLRAAVGLLASFALWTAAVCLVDVQAIGPEGSSVGFAALNGWVHGLTGVHMPLYALTDWLGLVPLFAALGFAFLGLGQLIKRKSLRNVDRSILALGGFYILVMAAYVFFEVFVINYRPVLIGGNLEASYPSSTTVLVMCVMPTAVMQIRARIKNKWLRRGCTGVMALFTVFMVAGRLLSGVHWVTDIVGGALLSGGLVMLYASLAGLAEEPS